MAKQIALSENDNRVNNLINFYRNAIDQGSLFIWAAGNRRADGTTMDEASIQAGLPYYVSGLYKDGLL